MSEKPTLTVQLMHAQARIAELEVQLAEARAAKPAYSNRKVVAPSTWQRPAWMEAARAQAMASGATTLAQH